MPTPPPGRPATQPAEKTQSRQKKHAAGGSHWLGASRALFSAMRASSAMLKVLKFC
jgi:hypothetical protein